MFKKIIRRALVLAGTLLFGIPLFAQISPSGTMIDSAGRLLYADYNLFDLRSLGDPAQVIIQKEVVMDYQCIPAPGNPPTGNVRFYCDSGTGNMACLTSSGASCLGGNPSSANMIDPTASPYNVKADGVIGGDGTTSNTLNTFSSASKNCAAGDTGKLAIVVGGAAGAYPFGTGIVTVTGCSGSSWVLSTTASSTIAGTANWAIGTDANPVALPALTNAWQAAYNSSFQASKTLATPCGVLLSSTPPFPKVSSQYSFMNRPHLQGCGATEGTTFVLSPNVSLGMSTGGTVFADAGGLQSCTGDCPAGIGGNSEIINMEITTLGGFLPATGSQNYNVINGFPVVRWVSVQQFGATTGNWVAVNNGSGESDFVRLNLQNLNGTSATWYGANFGGQGTNGLLASVLAFITGGGGSSAAVTCAGGGIHCTLTADYITSNRQGVQSFNTGNVITITGSDLEQSASYEITDNSAATTFYLFGNSIISNATGSFYTINLGNASTVMDISGSAASSLTSGYIFTGSGTVNDRGANTFSSPFTQFTSGKYNPQGGGSMSASFTTAATNFGTAIGSTALVSSVLFSAPMNVYVATRQVLAGASCGAGSNTAQVTISYTAPGGTAETPTATTLTVSANGALDTGASASQIISFTPKIGTAVNYSVASALASAGCSPVPQYAVDLRVQ